MKRTTIVLDDALVSKGMKLTGIKTRKALVIHALAQLLRSASQLGLLKLRGAVNWEGDIRAVRKGRVAFGFSSIPRFGSTS